MLNLSESEYETENRGDTCSFLRSTILTFPKQG
jgi:hypothetical protein